MNDNKSYSSVMAIEVPEANDKKIDVVAYVKDRFKYLYKLKQPRFPKYWQYRSEYSQLNQNDNTEDGFTNYYMNTWFALVNAKVA